MRPGSMIGCVGVPHGVQFDGQQLFLSQRGLLGGPAPVRHFLPHLINLVLERKINPGKVFDLELPLADVAKGYQAMDERSAVKVLLRVNWEDNAMPITVTIAEVDAHQGTGARSTLE